jgi:hypothetical protein
MRGDFPSVMFQCIASLLLLILLPLVITRWRLGKRGRLLGLSCRPQWLALALVLLTAFCVPLADLAPTIPSAMNHLVYLLLGLLALALLWLLVAALRVIFGRPGHALRRTTTGRTLTAAWTFALLLMCLSLPFLYQNERHWIQQDRLLEISAETPGFTRHEWQITEILRTELRDLLPPAQPY